MPPGPGKEDIYCKFRAHAQAQQSNASKQGKPKTSAQQANNAVSTTTSNKRANDGDAAPDNMELKRRRAIAAGGAPPLDPDGNPQPGVTNDDDDDEEPERIKPKNPAWAAAVWALDPGANEATREALGYQPIYEKVRQLLRCCTEYAKHTHILTYGINHHNVPAEERPGCGQDTYDDDVEAEELWPLWVQYFPEIKDHLDYLADNPPLIVIIGNFVTGVAAKVRSDDLGRVNDRIVDLCNFEDPRLLNVKDNCGWQDSRTGRLLCPIRYLPKYDSDPARFCTNVRNRLVRMFSTDYPSFLYDMSMIDADDPVAGLLRGEVLVNAYKTVMTGKSSVFKAPSRATRGQKSVAATHKMHAVNLHSIVYIALLTRSALGQHEWSDTDGRFWKAENFVASITEIAFTFPAWHDEIIKWWNRQIFGDDEELDSDAERDLEGTAFYAIMAQHGGSGSGADDDNNHDNNSAGEPMASGSTRMTE